MSHLARNYTLVVLEKTIKTKQWNKINNNTYQPSTAAQWCTLLTVFLLEVFVESGKRKKEHKSYCSMNKALSILQLKIKKAQFLLVQYPFS